MIDHYVSKFFEALFWIGALLTIASFFYSRWFMITIILGILLMMISAIREGFRLRRAKTTIGVIKKNEPKIIHRFILLIVVMAVFTYILLKQVVVYNLVIQLYDLTRSPATITWWVFVLIGIIIGLILLFVAVQIWRVKYGKITVWLKLKHPDLKLNQPKGALASKKKERMVAKNVKTVKPGFFKKLLWEEKGFWGSIIAWLSKKLEKRKAKKTEQEKIRLEKLRQEKIKKLKQKVKEENVLIKTELKKHPMLPRLLIVLFIFAITTILVLHRKGKFSIENPVSAASLGLITGLFLLYIVINLYKARREKVTKKQNQKKALQDKIKDKVVAKASKYETDIDKIYKLINEVGCLTLTEISEGFGITKEQAEEWGKILESHDLIELNYPAIGELQLCKKKSKITE